MTVREVITALENLAPREHQDEWDNSGIQVSLDLDAEFKRGIVCLDITEEVLDEAIDNGANLIISHHPLIFRALKSISDATYQQRCVIKAINYGITIYSAHTSLDNSINGVNHRIAHLLGLENLRWLDSGLSAEDGKATHGSGLIGTLSQTMTPEEFASEVKETFKVKALNYSLPVSQEIKTVALCGGAGAFLLPQAVAAGADCFICGEFHYHDYFCPGTMLIETGHYESEQYTQDLIVEYLKNSLTGIDVRKTRMMTNPILCMK